MEVVVRKMRGRPEVRAWVGERSPGEKLATEAAQQVEAEPEPVRRGRPRKAS